MRRFVKRCSGRFTEHFADDGGYILVYVMVVIVVLSILAVSICTSAVHNLKVQQHSVEHMKFVYEVEGIGERFVSELQSAVRFEADGTTDKVYPVEVTEGGQADQKYQEAATAIFSSGFYRNMESVDGAVKIAAKNALMDPSLEGDTIQIDEVTIGEYNPGSGEVEAEVLFHVVSGDSSLDSRIAVTMTVEMMEIPANPSGSEPARCEYEITEIQFEYKTYQIGSVEVPEEGGGEE